MMTVMRKRIGRKVTKIYIAAYNLILERRIEVNCLYVHVPVAYSLMKIGLSYGNATMIDWAGPNMANTSTAIMAPKWAVKSASSASSRAPAFRKIKPIMILVEIIMERDNY